MPCDSSFLEIGLLFWEDILSCSHILSDALSVSGDVAVDQ